MENLIKTMDADAVALYYVQSRGSLCFRDLRADEIECRLQTVSEKGCSLLLYKDARVDQAILDETVGPLNWKRSHESIDGRLYCTVSIYDPMKREWISKQDVGTESYTEKEKGQASDSFKRACFNLGIGRELYTAPFIWIFAGKGCTVQQDSKGRYVCRDIFEVADIKIENKKIRSLVIVNKRTRAVVFSYQR